MIKRLIYFAVLIAAVSAALSFYLMKPKQSYNIILQFVARNGYGNNLYIDNINFGRRAENDLAVTSINNIPKDTTFLNSLYVYKIAPRVNVTNLGYTAIANDTIIMTVNSVSYTSKDTVGAIAPGETKVIEFDSLTITPGISYDIMVYVNSIDSTSRNDTLKQTSLFLAGAYRNILVEEFTSTTSPSCAGNNPYLDAYLNANFQYVCPVKYHLGIPYPALDSMFFADSVHQKQRANYYFVYAVPSTFLDGKSRLSLPYSNDSNISIPFNERFLTGSPLSVQVSDARLPGDTIQATITVNLLHNISSNNLRLRVYAIERYKKYTTAPGTNGEKDFYDIFRGMYPDSAGTTVSNTAGSYTYTFKYHRDSTWTDSLIYTLAFVQDDNSKEVLNCGKGRQYAGLTKNLTLAKPNTEILRKADIGKNNFIQHSGKPYRNSDTLITGNFILEGFEGPFPPAGWTILNPDVGFTFEKLHGYNGPTYGGLNCIKIPFYDYPNIGEKDTLVSVELQGITPEDTLWFDYAYAQYLSNYVDSLIVSISTDGGTDFYTIFAEGGHYLATSQATTLSFAPSSSSQWVTVYYPMSAILPSNPLLSVPSSYKLFQNYPNPFNPKTTIKFDLPHNVFVTIKIYDLLGREIKTLVNRHMTAGQKTVDFQPESLASGIYFYRIIAGDFKEVKRMVYIK
ncbi:MAG: T9SS type A sorting domain-containing protein [Ignavibacteriae bacterium]|nr:T9SS type A sorting domain-containing protein [Ignavibacteriota bacterium]